MSHEANMKLTFLGSGSAFTVGANNYHSNMLLEDDNHNRLLVDCGSDVRLSLFALGLSYQDITDVYISHLHADHVGGLEWLAISTRFNLLPPRKPILHISEALLDSIWNNVLRGGLSSIKEEKVNLSTYFDVQPVSDGGAFLWHGHHIQLVKTVHFYNDHHLNPSYGLFFETNGRFCFITTDTQCSPIFLPYYEKADIIFHDCETSAKASGVHATYDELSALAPAIKAKMWLYHYNPGDLPDARKDGFQGFVKCGQSFEL